MNDQDQLRDICAALRIGIHFTNHEKNLGKPWIFLKKRNLTIGEFFCIDDAIAWLKPHPPSPTGTSVPHSESKS